ncbi:hypothetical protein D3C81_1089980 [compost metagenome]
MCRWHQRCVRPGRHPGRRFRRRRARGNRSRFQGRAGHPAESPGASGRSYRGTVPGAPRQKHRTGAEAIRRPAERRHRRCHRTGYTRRFRVGRARQALHRPGLRYRPGQAGQHQRPGHRGALDGHQHPGNGHHHVPPQLHADHLRRRGWPALWAPVRAGAFYRAACLAPEERRRV